MQAEKSPFRWVVLALLLANILIATLAMNCIPPLFKEIGMQIPLTKAQMGTVMGALMLASLVVAPVGGAVSDRIGSRLGLGIAALIIAAGGMLRATAGSATGLTVHMFFIGAGLAIFGPNMPKALGMWFPKKELGLANGLCLAAMGIGGAIAMATAASFMSPAFGGWRGTMVYVGAVNLVAAVLWLIFFRDRSAAGGGGETGSMAKNFRKVLGVRDIWLLSIFYGLNMAGIMTVVSLLPISLAERGIERGGEMVGVMMGTAVIFNIAGGVFSDLTGRRKPFLIIGTVVLGLSVLLATQASGPVLVVALACAGAAMGTVGPVMMVIPIEIEEIGPKLTATAMGVIFMIGNAGGFAGPVVSGRIMDYTGSNISGFMLMAALLIIAAGFIFPLRETGKKK